MHECYENVLSLCLLLRASRNSEETPAYEGKDEPSEDDIERLTGALSYVELQTRWGPLGMPTWCHPSDVPTQKDLDAGLSAAAAADQMHR